MEISNLIFKGVQQPPIEPLLNFYKTTSNFKLNKATLLAKFPSRDWNLFYAWNNNSTILSENCERILKDDFSENEKNLRLF